VDAALLSVVLEHTRDGLLVLDDDGRVVGANAAIGKLLGQPPDELTGLTIEELAPAEARAGLAEAWAGLLRDGAAEGVFRLPGPLAPELEYVARANLRPGRHLVEVRDITGFYEEQEIHRAVIQNAVEMISLFDLEGRYLFASPSHARTMGYEPSALVGTSVFDVVDPAGLEETKPLLGRVLAGETIVWNGRVKHADGSLRTLNSTALLIRNESGEPRMILSVSRDVTEAEALEQSLRASERRYRDLFENAGELIVLTDATWRITSANRAFLEAVGLAAEEVVGQDVHRFLSKGELARARDSSDEGAELASYTMELRARGGEKRVLEVSSRLLVEDGVTVGMQATARDITERIELEERLAHAQKMEALGRLAGGIAHDFNNLLTAMVGYSDFALALVTADSEAHRAVQEIMKAAQRATALTTQLLAFSRRQVVDRQVLDPNEVVAEMGALLRRVIGEQLELELALSRRAGWVRSDRSQLEQIITNLVVNARDSMPAGGGRIVIATGSVELDEDNPDRLPAGPYTMISVQDSGAGMDEGTVARIFEPFFTTKQPGQGTGLGLATVYGIVTQGGGAVQVASKLGEGSTFVVLLPEALPSDVAGEVQPGEEPEEGPLARILVVEDEEVVRNLVRSALERRGHVVTVASDGQEALRLCADLDREIDLLLTDVVMPQLNGAELAERVAALRPELRVVFMSGYTRGTIDERGLLQPGRAFLQKPFTVAELLQTVTRMLAGALPSPSLD
jgi:two-component system, cell cycle sensor histidine kinase and response regulator CckA